MTTNVNHEPDYEIVDPVTEKPIEDKKAKKALPKEESAPATPDETPDLPEKFKGKSPAEIAKAYEEQEKLMSRQANELGELRKSVNELIQRELEEAKSAKEASKMEAALEYDDLIDNPETSIRRVVTPEIEAVKKEFNQFKAQQAQEKFKAEHPDFMEIAASAEFQGWVSDSPFRTRMFYAADAGDLEAARDLFNEYKSRNYSVTEATGLPAAGRDKALKAVTTESGNATGSAKRKMYRRSDLVNLRLRDPEAYNAKSAEITQAYLEKRVIDDIT